MLLLESLLAVSKDSDSMLEVQVESQSPWNVAFAPKVRNPGGPPFVAVLSPNFSRLDAFPDPTPASCFRYSGPDVEFEHIHFIIHCIYLINFVSLVMFVKTDELKTFYSPLPAKKK